MKTVDVIIPTYKPDKKLIQLLDQLRKQTVSVQKVILVNTEEKYLDRLIYGSDFSDRYKNVSIYHHSKKEFDHGNTRNKGVKISDSDIFVMMTQDAVPQDERLIENLVKALEQDNVAVAYARQLPEDNCREIEKFTRSFNYPNVSMVKSKADLPKLGIKTYFCSNVCAAYKRKDFIELGGFIKHTIFNEDMLFAYKVIQADKKIAYAADALVVHSHNYTAKDQLKRNFDLGVSQADNPEVFENVPSESEGIKLVKNTILYLLKQRKWMQIPLLFVHSACKFLGYRLGKKYNRLSKKMILKLTSNKEYWRKYQMKKDVSNIDATRGYRKNLEKER